MKTCCHCQKPAAKGYERDPITGKLSAFFWCDPCFENLMRINGMRQPHNPESEPHKVHKASNRRQTRPRAPY